MMSEPPEHDADPSGWPLDLWVGRSGPIAGGAGGRASFEARELAAVCARHGLGTVERATPIGRGSPSAPKLLLETPGGRFVLKRRSVAPGGADFAHALQEHLRRHGFPLPRLVPLPGGGAGALVVGSTAYELFEFVAGPTYDASSVATEEAGRVLARFHALASMPTVARAAPVRVGYHAAPAIRRAIAALAGEPADGADLRPIARRLRALYDHAARSADAAGASRWPRAVIHRDWHPGNLVFRGGRVVAVLDYDEAAAGVRVVDVAAGMLQFSIAATRGPIEAWPAAADVDRIAAFARGYAESAPGPLLAEERDAVPWLMVEAMIGEGMVSVRDAAAARRSAIARMVDAKAAWLAAHGAEVARVCGG